MLIWILQKPKMPENIQQGDVRPLDIYKNYTILYHEENILFIKRIKNNKYILLKTI